MAKNALRKLRSTRHPDVLKFIDSVENDSTIYYMTERVRPLAGVLPGWSSKGAKDREDWLIWGLHRISVRDLAACCRQHQQYSTGSLDIPQ
jgi:SCY1-like protein 1